MTKRERERQRDIVNVRQANKQAQVLFEDPDGTFRSNAERISRIEAAEGLSQAKAQTAPAQSTKTGTRRRRNCDAVHNETACLLTEATHDAEQMTKSDGACMNSQSSGQNKSNGQAMRHPIVQLLTYQRLVACDGEFQLLRCATHSTPLSDTTC